MPGLGNWRTIYSLEFLQLKEEGYPVEDFLNEEHGQYLPVRDTISVKNENDNIPEKEWERAYNTLCKVREKGIAKDFPYCEPNDYNEIIACAKQVPELRPLDDKRYMEKLRGAWFGRCAGVVLGKPFESNLNRLFIKEYLESLDAYPLNDYVPEYSEKLDIRLRCPGSTKRKIAFVEDDDDTRYTVLALLLAESKGLDFTKYDICQNVLQNVPYTELWSAMKQTIYNFINMTDDRPYEEQIDEFTTKINPMREGINGTIRADFWGYISPANPRRAARIAHKEASLNMVKNGLYGAMFAAACISGALSKNPSIDTIIDCGISVIPSKSRLAKVIEEVRAWYQKDKDWTKTCDRIYEKYGHLPFAGGLNNLAIIVLSLLHGELDFTKSITTAVMCGMDTDCNAGTVGSIVGAAIGYENIEPKWITPFNDTIKTCASKFTQGSISELVERTFRVYQNVKGVEI